MNDKYKKEEMQVKDPENIFNKITGYREFFIKVQEAYRISEPEIKLPGHIIKTLNIQN